MLDGNGLSSGPIVRIPYRVPNSNENPFFLILTIDDVTGKVMNQVIVMAIVALRKSLRIIDDRSQSLIEFRVKAFGG